MHPTLSINEDASLRSNDLNATFGFGRDLCNDVEAAARKEWLVTNGIGGFASCTVAGHLTRRYHGLLVAALKPPLGRTLMVSKLEEVASYSGVDYALSTNRWASQGVHPKGHNLIDQFQLIRGAPVWTYAFADALLEKRIWMAYGENTTCVRYDLTRAGSPVRLALKALVNYRGYHGSTHAGGWRMGIEPIRNGLCVSAFDGAALFYLLSRDAKAVPEHTWYRDFYLDVEAYRGLDAVEDHLHAGTFTAVLEPGASLTMTFSTERGANLDGISSYHAHAVRAAQLHAKAGAQQAPEAVKQLVLAADQFVVHRPTAADPNGQTLIAGYPWFGDWGRDTMIALPGLTLQTGRPEVAACILRTFAQYVDRGMLPNRFPDDGEQPEYNTVDATLWFIEAVRAYLETTNDLSLVKDLYPVLEDIIAWHVRGTRYNIHVDREDGLLYAGEPGVQLTWMDAKVGDYVVTPRIGKPVEVNALWYNALRSMAAFGRRLKRKKSKYDEEADRVRIGFDRFWRPEAGYCYDVLDAPGGDDASFRPNQLLAVSLKHSPLNPKRQKAIVDACAARLLTPHGLRSLAPDHPSFAPHYGGDIWKRDGAYHQGTVWSWLIGPFVEAHLRVYEDVSTAASFLQPLLRHLSDHGLGSVSEIFDGEAPFTPRGCFAQAWGVAEVLRAWKCTQDQL